MEFYAMPTTIRRLFMIVSIPNGMEFYEKDKRSRGAETHVSIPNGMEFYFSKSAVVKVC